LEMDTKALEVEVIPPARPGRRRRFNAEEKQRFLAEAEMAGQSISSVARRYGLSASMLFHWRRLAEEGSMSSLGADEAVVPESEVKRLQAQVRELERLLGKKTMENEILKEALELARPKKRTSPLSLPSRSGSR
ncbi:transposase, partial [Myxococcus virescens]